MKGEDMKLPVTVNNPEYYVTMRVRSGHSDDMIVFVHGLGCSKEAFAGAWTQSALADYDLLSFDLLGFGNSAKPLELPYTVQMQADVLRQVIEQTGHRRIHLVANSWGPIIALQLPADMLNHVASFANLEGRMVLEDVGNAHKAASLSYSDFERSFWPQLKESTRHDQTTAYRLTSALPQAYYQGAVSIVEAVSQGELPAKFLGLQCAKAYVYGDQNRHLKSIAAIKPTPTIEISEAGHFMMKDNPAEFYQKLGIFLKSI